MNFEQVILPRPLATQAQAEAGTNNTKSMSPLRTAQAIAALGGAGGNTNLSFSGDDETVTINSSTGTDAEILTATTTDAGVMSANQVIGLAAAYYHSQQTGNPHILAWGDIGGTLSSQADLQVALDDKLSNGYQVNSAPNVYTTWTQDTWNDGAMDWPKGILSLQATEDSGTIGTVNIVIDGHDGVTFNALNTSISFYTNTYYISNKTAFRDQLSVYSTIQVDAAIAAAVTGLLDFKGATNCSGNPNYPAASKGDSYVVSVAGKIGGASGTSVDIGDVYVASADNAGGTQASVGTSWFLLEHNVAGALLAANNLSDLASASTARTNLGLGTMAVAATSDYLALAGGLMTAAVRHTEVTSTPSGTTQTMTLANGNHQTIALTSASGNVTLTLTVPTGSSAGTIIYKQHASAQKDLTWAVSAGTIKWMGTEPDWVADAVSAVRVVSWRYDGSVTYLAATEVGT